MTDHTEIKAAVARLLNELKIYEGVVDTTGSFEDDIKTACDAVTTLLAEREWISVDKRKLNDSIKYFVAQQLHYFENISKLDLNNVYAREITDMAQGGIDRFKHDPIYNAKVNSMVAGILQLLDNLHSPPPEE